MTIAMIMGFWTGAVANLFVVGVTGFAPATPAFRRQPFEAMATVDEVLAAADFGWGAEMLTGQVACVEVPPFLAIDLETMAAFAQAGHEALDAYRAQASCGWVADLRRNSGGNMWGMLPGLQPLLGEGEVGAFVNRKGNRLRWKPRWSG